MNLTFNAIDDKTITTFQSSIGRVNFLPNDFSPLFTESIDETVYKPCLLPA